jgi:beta-mannosidase
MKRIDLSGEWLLQRTATKETFPASIPGDTHSALLAAGKIQDPYVGTNELDVQWVGREDWIYERGFEVTESFLRETAVFLECECLDTVAEILINGKRIGRADNMFLRWRFDAKPFLKPGNNRIRILFHSAEKTAAAEAAKLPYPIPHTAHPVQSPHRNLIRKVQCHSGWDWGPCLMVSGIYGEIYLGASSTVRIDHVYTEQKHGNDRCTVRIFVECEAFTAGRYELSVDLQGISAVKKVELLRGYNRASLDVHVEKPNLWWPNGLGSQPLYTLTVGIGGHSMTKKIGLRALELVTRRDRIGSSMFFRVNGVELFCKGANWIPIDALPQRSTRERLNGLLCAAAAAHMNMLRVWGGGKYETEDFYGLCDEKGIMVWQDMMFACALYPGNPAFLASVDAEVRYQVKRLRDHPCIALWCGNNENLGALSWFPESKANRDRYLVDYDRLYEGVIGRAVDECDPTRRYWPSSPSAGRNQYSDNWHDDTRGDMHFWSVWHDGKSFDAYASVSPRFCSEFGYQSFPSLQTIREYAPEGSFNPTSPVLEHHQRGPAGNSKITEMFTRYFRVPEGFESFVYLSQVQQVLAIKTAVEYWRSLRPVCMGTLYWQLNDNWPVCSWSSIEYGGKWKLLHYAAARFFAPVLLAAYRSGPDVEVWAVNDLPEEAGGRAIVSVKDFTGKTLSTDKIELRVPAGSAKRIKKYPFQEVSGAPEKSFLLLTLLHDGKTTVNEFFFTEYKRCELLKTDIQSRVSEKNGRFNLQLKTDHPAFFVSVEVPGVEGEFDDNCFTLIKDMPRELVFTPRRSAPERRDSRSGI